MLDKKNKKPKKSKSISISCFTLGTETLKLFRTFKVTAIVKSGGYSRKRATQQILFDCDFKGINSRPALSYPTKLTN